TILPSLHSIFALIIRLPPTSTLFPYTTLFRSHPVEELGPFDLERLPHCFRRHDPSGGKPLNRIGVHKGSDKAPTKTVSAKPRVRSEEHTSELQSRFDLVCRLLLEKKKLQSRRC